MNAHCALVLQKQFNISDDARTIGNYAADNVELHQCQYLQEMTATPDFLVEGNFPTYEDWSKAHPEFRRLWLGHFLSWSWINGRACFPSYDPGH